ncbi:PTS mannose transporter subunit IIA [Exiguobacterium chiriqhucha RW-2]|uniref:PTS mannose transporter subunit IIA n=2 Tax=Bacillales Family XII. Incertae Sedis TaxID=539742 RepID=U1LYQ5_9BACL|nr:PTS mannose transporter subunit IIA [Exiguobacterium chiriqhucha RW-2]TCI22555.1 PTS lactose/cellobiose transporter subunit IIA [Exiguobacterium sp. SL-9]TCI30355.1 PTS lactose/cellobiose transporter subunit IIA [Exiguobacterium sp. SL-10]
MKTETMQQLSFMIILHAGNARSSAFEAIAAAKRGEVETAEAKMKEADAAFLEAHKMQTELLQEEARGTASDMSVLLVHAQDHLMTAMTVKELAIEMIDMITRLNRLEETK